MNKFYKNKIFLLVAFLSLVFFSGILYQGWRRAVAALAPGSEMPLYVRDSRYSTDFNDFTQWLFNDLAKQRSPWTTSQAQILIDVLNAGYTQEQAERAAQIDAEFKDIEPSFRLGFVMDAIANRLRFNDPIETEAKEMLTIALVERLNDPFWRVRKRAAHYVVHARLPLIPTIRIKLESMQYDENNFVATGVKAALVHFEEIERLRAEGEWRERGIDYAVRK